VKSRTATATSTMSNSATLRARRRLVTVAGGGIGGDGRVPFDGSVLRRLRPIVGQTPLA
jgi:hypothetical protein